MLDPILKKQYSIITDSRYLCEESDIVPYFKDSGIDFFDCGQGYSQDEATVIIAIHDTYYEVTMKASIMSSKQDRGDRLYWVEDITDVTYTEIPEPAYKNAELTPIYIEEYQLNNAIRALKDVGIKYLLSNNDD